MKTILQFLFVLASAGMAWAQTQIVVLGGLENVEGNSASFQLFGTTQTSYQQVFSASEFTSLGAPLVRIDGMAFRFDGEINQSFHGLWPGYSVILSTTGRSPENLSPNYADNAGLDAVDVAGGLLGIFAPSTLGVRSFQLNIPFATPFFYDPSKGNLSMFIGTSSGPTTLMLDAQSAAGDSIGRVYGDGLSGTVDSVGLVTRFQITLIPEPPVSLIGAAGALLTLLCRVRRIQKHQSNLGKPC